MTRPGDYDRAKIRAAILLGVGSAHQVAEPEDMRGRLSGHILIPDVDERRGWREWYVYAPAPEAAQRRPLGFRRP